MKTTINRDQFVDAFQYLRPDNFSNCGLALLWDYFEQLEEDLGEQIELDVIDICCNFHECSEKEFSSMGVSEDSIIGKTLIDTIVFVC